MTTPISKKAISRYFSELAKKSHKKHPRLREFYSAMGKKSAKMKKKLSTV